MILVLAGWLESEAYAEKNKAAEELLTETSPIKGSRISDLFTVHK